MDCVNIHCPFRQNTTSNRNRCDSLSCLYRQESPVTYSSNIYTEQQNIRLQDVYRIIAGHSDYHGDDILAALTCLAEGKLVNPVKPLQRRRDNGRF